MKQLPARPLTDPAVVLAVACLLGLAIAVAGLTVLPACDETTTSTFCSYDSDCPETGTPFCVNGICQPDECAEARDCDEGESCVEGVCSAAD